MFQSDFASRGVVQDHAQAAYQDFVSPWQWECLQQGLQMQRLLIEHFLVPAHKKRGKGGRQPAADPRLDPSIDERKAKRILANRLSAARSKMKQKNQTEVIPADITINFMYSAGHLPRWHIGCTDFPLAMNSCISNINGHGRIRHELCASDVSAIHFLMLYWWHILLKRQSPSGISNADVYIAFARWRALWKCIYRTKSRAFIIN